MAKLAEVISNRFQQDTKDHVLTEEMTQGVLRSYTFRNPKSSAYWLRLVTYPNGLVLTGDMGTWTFERTNDMVEFFRGHNGINPYYWMEKLQAGTSYRTNTKMATDFDESATMHIINKLFEEWLEEAKERVKDPHDKYSKETFRNDKEEFSDDMRSFKREMQEYSYDDFGFYIAFENHLRNDSNAGTDSPWNYNDGIEAQRKLNYHYVWACYAINHICNLIYKREQMGDVMDKFLAVRESYA